MRQPGSPLDLLLWREVFALGRTRQSGPALSGALFAAVAALGSIALTEWTHGHRGVALGFVLTVVAALSTERAMEQAARLEGKLERRRQRRAANGRGALYLLGRFALVLGAAFVLEAVLLSAVRGSLVLSQLASNTLGAFVCVYFFLWFVHLMRTTVGSGDPSRVRVRLDQVLGRAAIAGPALAIVLAVIGWLVPR
jgi:hypothetical protein